MPSAPYLYRLKVYSLENIVFEMEAIEKYCQFANPAKSANSAIAAVGPNTILSDINKILYLYIITLGIARRLKLRDSILAFNPPSVSMCRNRKYIGADKARATRRIKDIIAYIIRSVGLKAYRDNKNFVVNNIKFKSLAGTAVVPGKNFHLWYLNEKVGAAGGNSHGQSSIASYLADYCTLSLEPKLRHRLKTAVRR
jgi:hypothetical protein